jgi:hypothetical protein
MRLTRTANNEAIMADVFMMEHLAGLVSPRRRLKRGYYCRQKTELD